MRRAAWAAAALLLPLGAACSSDQEVYCEAVRDQQTRLSDILAGGEPDALLRALPAYRQLQQAAVSDIRDDWAVVVDALEDLDQALTDAGVDPATYDPAKPPAGVTEEQRAAIERAAAGLLDPRTEEAFAAVDQQARDVCGTPLNQ
ncbi:hypothetical protein [Nocardioides euryhalodurans]|uniref:Uncharacterized protein n=1 Tax=Nocardioides euryhalodurans TaxID=2518370 RepID=A0A4P7GHT2_9ACTN|nr:hypothetical protein [Nocardioides euryhalodurans]QBR91343.1 hypothetical protein EXE57_02950 [Nocardioides euryhalodurans]